MNVLLQDLTLLLREQAGLKAKVLPAVAPDARDQLAAHVVQASLNNGKQADMIEAVAEGVIFNNLAHIMDTHINRLLVLRPQLTAAERTDFLVEVFSYLGEEYLKLNFDKHFIPGRIISPRIFGEKQWAAA